MRMFVMSPQRLNWEPVIGFHVRLREIRRQHGDRLGVTITQAEMAEAIEVGLSAYKQWEAGNNLPKDLRDIAERIHRVTGVSAAWLLGETDGDGPTGGGNIIDLRRPSKGPDVPKAQYIYTERDDLGQQAA